MTLGSLGVLSVASPWILIGIAALPVIRWLLKLTPPQRETIAFPPTLLLLKLLPTDRTPVRSPWWLTLLRMLVALCAIVALSGPTLKPASSQTLKVTRPVLVVIDNGWAAASRWAKRIDTALQVASAAEDAGLSLYLVTTAGPQSTPRLLSSGEFRKMVQGLVPQSYSANRSGAAEQITKAFPAEAAKPQAVWLTDGIEDDGADALRKSLSLLAGSQTIDVIGDGADLGALAIARAGSGVGAELRVRVQTAESLPRTGTVAALTLRGDRLASVPFVIGSGVKSVDVPIGLPLELRNQVARVAISGEDSAGAVYLFDGRSQRRRVGVIASEDAEAAQPLLSPIHYLEKALAPFADVAVARTANIDQATAELVAGQPSAIVLSDVGRLSGASFERLKTYVEKGGTLIRFAGPRLEQGGDGLLPAPLREGGRVLGGSLTWSAPQKLAAFESGSPFEGLTIPSEVSVTRQILADPARVQRSALIYARLTDGTPLVTAAKRGAGQTIFFHVTANPDWSNLPLSGLFIEMLRKTVESAPAQPGTSPEPQASDAKIVERTDAVLKPWRLMDGFGKLQENTGTGTAAALATLDPGLASQKTPAGLYGPQNATRAVNIMNEKSVLKPLDLPANANRQVFVEAASIVLSPWLFLAAFALFVTDTLISAFVYGSGARRIRTMAAAMAVLSFSMAFLPRDAQAEVAKDATADATRFALQASVETRFAFVVTGDAEADKVSQAGISGLSKLLMARTAVEPGEPVGIDPLRDEFVFFPLIYWPVLAKSDALPDAVLAKIDAYMKQGGLIVFDTKSDESLSGVLANSGAATPLSRLLGKLDLPPLQRIPEDHVLTRSFYLLQSFPGRWDSGDLWVEAPRASGVDGRRRGVRTDGVSSIIITSNDLAAAWATDESDRPMYAMVPGGEEQREMANRVGINIVMYALTGNYKADQVHVPAILERLGH